MLRRLLLAVALVALFPATSAAPPPLLTALDPFEIYADGFGDLRGIAVDAQGNVFVSDRAAGTVTRIAPDHSRSTVASSLDRPIGLAFDPQGRLLIAEEKAARVVRVEANGSRTTILSGVKQPRWLAALEDGTLFLSARRLTRDTDPEPDDESAEPEMILVLRPNGTLGVFADGFKNLQGLAANHTGLFAATQGLAGTARVDGVVYQIPIRPDGTAGARVQLGPSDQYKKPVGLARDALGALYLTTKELDLNEDKSKRAVAKLYSTAAVTLYAQNLDKPQGLAFDADGNLYVADGTSGRVLRFRAPPAPTVTSSAITNQSPFTVTGTTQPGARVDLFVHDATTSITATVDAIGAFTASATLTLNASNDLDVFATSHGGQGLTSRPAETAVVHDSIAPGLSFQAPSANAYVRGSVSVQAQATDAGTGVQTFALTVDGQTLSATVTPALPAASATATASWDTLSIADGTHTLAATATDRAGNTATASRVVIVDNTPPDTQVTAGPTGTINATSATFSFTGTDNLTPIGNLVFAWRLDGGAWSAFGSATTVSISGLSSGPHTFEVKARDLAGNEGLTPAQRGFTVSVSSVQIAITEPASGATVPAGQLLVRGTVAVSGAEVGVRVNGLPAAIQGTTFVAQVVVTPETGNLTAVATTGTGATASHTIALSVSAPSTPFVLRASPSIGVVGLTAKFTLDGGQTAHVDLDANGDGVTDFSGTVLNGQAFTFTTAGMFVARASVASATGDVVIVNTVIQVLNPSEQDTLFQEKWATLRTALTQDDIERAVSVVVDGQKDKYRAALQNLRPDLPAVAATLAGIRLVSFNGLIAAYATPLSRDGGTFVHFIYFMQDLDGIWKIVGM